MAFFTEAGDMAEYANHLSEFTLPELAGELAYVNYLLHSGTNEKFWGPRYRTCWYIASQRGVAPVGPAPAEKS